MSAPNCANSHWSPDGRKILFQSAGRATPRALWVLDVATGRTEPLTDGPLPDLQASWSRDGKTIYFLSVAGEDRQIWRMPSAGGQRKQVTRQGGSFAIESVDRQYLYYAKVLGKGLGIWRVPVDGGAEIPIVDNLKGVLNFAVGKKGLYFITATEDLERRPVNETLPLRDTIEFFDFTSGRRTTLAPLDKSVWVGLALSPDERYLLYSALNSESRNLMLVDKIE